MTLSHRATTCVALAAAVAAFTLHPNAATASFSCANQTHDIVGADGATSSSNTNVNGVTGTFYVPNLTTGNLYGQPTSAADVAMMIEDSARHSFQLGWYLGYADGLPSTSSPRLFAGEATLMTGTETLTLLARTVPPGSWHTFRLVQDESPLSTTYRHYLGYVDGTRVWTSAMVTTIEGTPRMIGETNWDCADMYAHASTSGGGASLQGHHVGSSWSYWQEHPEVRVGEPYTTRSCWFDGRINGSPATVFAYDQC